MLVVKWEVKKLKHIFHGKVEKGKVRRNIYMTMWYDYSERGEEANRKIKEPDFFLTVKYTTVDHIVVSEKSELDYSPEISHEVHINNVNCKVVERKYDADKNTMHYYLDHIAKSIEPTEEEFNKLRNEIKDEGKKIKEEIKEYLRKKQIEKERKEEAKRQKKGFLRKLFK